MEPAAERAHPWSRNFRFGNQVSNGEDDHFPLPLGEDRDCAYAPAFTQEGALPQIRPSA